MIIFTTIISILFEYFTIINIISIFYEKKDNSNFKTSLLISTMFFLFSTIFSNISFVFSILYIFFLINMYQIKSIKKKITYTIVIFLFLGILEIFITQICCYVYGQSVEMIINNQLTYSFVVILAKTISYLIVNFFKVSYIKKSSFHFDNVSGVVLLISICITVSFCILGNILFIIDDKSISFLGTIILLLLIIILLVFLMNNNLKNNILFSKYEINSLKQYILFNEKYNKKINDSMIEVKKIKHNLNLELAGISNMLRKGCIEDAIKYIEQTTNQLNKSLNESIYIGDSFIDGIINNLLLEAKSKKIDTKIHTDIINIGNIDKMDLGLLIGCAFDNAIEANLKNKGEKQIDISMSTRGHYFIFKIINPIDYTNKIDTKVSSKSYDVDNHGYGLKTIETISNKYSGTYDTFLKNKYFYLCIMLNIEKS